MLSADWPGSTVVCIASGPSLTVGQCERVRSWRDSGGCKVIAVNDVYMLAPWADVMYFADVRWHDWHKARPEFLAVTGRKISIENSGQAHAPGVLVLRNLSVVGGTMGRLSTDPAGIYTGQNSGYQAIQVGILLGAVRIVLLGYDMKPAKDGRNHFFGEHPVRQDQAIYRQWRMEYERMAPNAKAMGIEIVNATPGSDLESFPMVSLESLVDARLVADPV